MYHSIDRGFECRICCSVYRPGQLLIEAKEEDSMLYSDELYTVWICNKCSWSNDIKWSQCSMCSQKRPSPNKLKVFQFDEKPVKFEKYDIDYSNKLNNSFIAQQSSNDDKSHCHENKQKCNNDKSYQFEENQFVQNQFFDEHKLMAFAAIEKSIDHSDKAHTKNNNKSKQCIVMDTAFRLFDELQNWKDRTCADSDSDKENANHNLNKNNNNNQQQIKPDNTLNWNADFKFVE